MKYAIIFVGIIGLASAVPVVGPHGPIECQAIGCVEGETTSTKRPLASGIPPNTISLQPDHTEGIFIGGADKSISVPVETSFRFRVSTMTAPESSTTAATTLPVKTRSRRPFTRRPKTTTTAPALTVETRTSKNFLFDQENLRKMMEMERKYLQELRKQKGLKNATATSPAGTNYTVIAKPDEGTTTTAAAVAVETEVTDLVEEEEDLDEERDFLKYGWHNRPGQMDNEEEDMDEERDFLKYGWHSRPGQMDQGEEDVEVDVDDDDEEEEDINEESGSLKYGWQNRPTQTAGEFLPTAANLYWIATTLPVSPPSQITARYESGESVVATTLPTALAKPIQPADRFRCLAIGSVCKPELLEQRVPKTLITRTAQAAPTEATY